MKNLKGFDNFINEQVMGEPFKKYLMGLNFTVLKDPKGLNDFKTLLKDQNPSVQTVGEVYTVKNPSGQHQFWVTKDNKGGLIILEMQSAGVELHMAKNEKEALEKMRSTATWSDLGLD